MTHTSTQQPCMPQATIHPAQEECIKLQARIAELKAERDDFKMRLEAALRCVEHLEASQAQRVALSDESAFEAVSAVWILPIGVAIDVTRAIEAAHGITQEKQG